MSVDQTTGQYTVQVFIERPVVPVDLPFSTLAPGNYDGPVAINGATFDGIRYTTASGAAPYVNTDTNQESINPSGNGFGVGNNLIGDNEGFLFASPDSSALEFDINWQPGETTTTVSWQTYDSVTGALQSGSTVVNRAGGSGGEALTHVTISPTLQFDSMAVRFDTTSNNDTFRVENFSVSKVVIPADQPVQFAITVTDSDGDKATTVVGNDATTLDLYFSGGPPIPPVVVDLDGDGVEFLSRAAGVTFDYAGNGDAVATAWAGPDDGILAVDLDGDGQIDSASEFVFGSKDLSDLEGLAARFDSNGDGSLTAADSAFAQFGVWQDADSDGQSDAGEFQSLDTLGIASIGLVSDGRGYTAAGGEVVVRGEAALIRTDGTRGVVADASFAIGESRSVARSTDLVNSTVAATLLASALFGEHQQPATPTPTNDGQAHAPDRHLSAPHDAPTAGEAIAHPPVADVPDDASRAEAPATPRHAQAEPDSDAPAGTLAEADRSTETGADTGSEPAFATGHDAHGSALGSGNGADLMQALFALADKPTETSATDATATAPDHAAVQEALAQSQAEGFVDQLIEKLGAGDADSSAPSDDHGLQAMLAANVDASPMAAHDMFGANQSVEEAHALAHA